MGHGWTFASSEWSSIRAWRYIRSLPVVWKTSRPSLSLTRCGQWRVTPKDCLNVHLHWLFILVVDIRWFVRVVLRMMNLSLNERHLHHHRWNSTMISRLPRTRINNIHFSVKTTITKIPSWTLQWTFHLNSEKVSRLVFGQILARSRKKHKEDCRIECRWFQCPWAILTDLTSTREISSNADSLICWAPHCPTKMFDDTTYSR